MLRSPGAETVATLFQRVAKMPVLHATVSLTILALSWLRLSKGPGF